MQVYDFLTLAAWLVFLALWAALSVAVKRDAGEKEGWKSNRFAFSTALFFLALVLIVLAHRRLGALFSAGDLIPETHLSGAAGTALVMLGIGITIWARIHLGANWSARPAKKEGHELITSGPYRYVRRLIYDGILLAMLGTVLVAGPLWGVVLLFTSVRFLMRIPKEERYMMELFPDQYPAYKARTGALIPFVL